MLFAIQAYLEDYLNKRNLVDSDGYAVHLANLYFHQRSQSDIDSFLRRAMRIKTVMFANYKIRDRSEFERSLVRRLDQRFKKKLSSHNPAFPGGTEQERIQLQKLPRRTIGGLLTEFKYAVEARAVDSFWKSRKKEQLKPRYEEIAGALFAVFAYGVLGGKGLILKEIKSGIGFVDISVVFTSVLHLVELKVLTGTFTGPEQLEQYMKTERRREGSLLVMDAVKPNDKQALPKTIPTPSGIIKVYPVDINPVVPSSLKRTK